MTQRVLVTAGAGGIGLAVDHAFAAKGARVHVKMMNGTCVPISTTHQNEEIPWLDT